MRTKLDQLMESIDPARTLDKVSADVDRAINSFTMHRGTIQRWDEYEVYLADFARHIERIVLHMKPGIPHYKEFYWALFS